jgi:hypothetical protein
MSGIAAMLARERKALMQRQGKRAAGLGVALVEVEPSRVDYRELDARINALMEDPDMVGLALR